MPVIQPFLHIQITPTVQDVCAVVSAAAAYHSGAEEAFLKGIKEALDMRLEEIQKNK